MNIHRLHIEDLRNITALDLVPGAGINYLVGGNGVGKTTILEAIHLLGFGQSFRHGDSGPLIRRGASRDYCLVTAQLCDRQGKRRPLGIRRDAKEFFARYDGENVQRRSQLLRALPLQLLLPTSHELVEKGPEMRRRFLDQGLFHVEPDYHSLALDYLRVVRQRNAALRNQDSATARSFDRGLAEIGEKLTRYRANLAKKLVAKLNELLPSIGADWGRLEIDYKPGWRGDSLQQALSSQLSVDLKMGYTHSGPHRGEMKFMVEGQPVTKTLSRGQQKLLVYGLTLAYLEIFNEVVPERPVLLIDDISAELDRQRVDLLIQYLRKTGNQTFITALEPDPFVPREDEKVFHVEQLLESHRT